MAEIARPTSQAAYVLALMGLKGVGPWTALSAVRAFADPELLLAASATERLALLGKRFAGKLLDLSADEWPALLERAEEQVRQHQERGIAVVAVDDESYPPLMRLAPSPAVILYVRGSTELLRKDLAVAVIGTRKPTEVGVRVATAIAESLAASDVSIVSGLAIGIDAAAHRGALRATGATIAILGTAIDKIYPARHKPLAEEILEGGGTLISEYPIGFPSSGRHFVERDRLQAAMSAAVVAVQTGVEGGTLHTVRFARNANRAVIVPRPVESESTHPMYGGINRLIEDGEAEVIETRDDYPRLAAFVVACRDWLRGASPVRPRLDDAHADPGNGEQETLGL